jgi:RNA polymerase sigma-70 factor (ECF subfamily)
MLSSSASSSPSESLASIVALLNLGRAGSRTAIERLFSQYRPYLRVICTLRLPHFCQKREDESDIVQQTLLDALRGIADFRGQSEVEFEAWMKTLLENNILQCLRRNTAAKRDIRREVTDCNTGNSAMLVWHSMVADQSAPDRSIFRGEAALQLAAALERLPAEQRVAVELRYLGQHPLKFIAEYMSKSTGAVAGLICRGVKSLRIELPGDLGSIAE